MARSRFEPYWARKRGPRFRIHDQEAIRVGDVVLSVGGLMWQVVLIKGEVVSVLARLVILARIVLGDGVQYVFTTIR